LEREIWIGSFVSEETLKSKATFVAANSNPVSETLNESASETDCETCGEGTESETDEAFEESENESVSASEVGT